MKEQLISLSNCNSHSHNYLGIETCINKLKQLFSPLKAECTEINLPPYSIVDDHANKCSIPVGNALQFTKRPDSPIRILLSGHVDTVYSKTSSFQNVKETSHNTLNGPGVCDMKGGLIILLYALQALEKSPYADKIGWQVVLTPDEEIGSPSSYAILEQAAKRNHLGLVFEPSFPDGALVTTRPASANFVIVVRGKAAHSGRDYTSGRSALNTAARLVCDLQELNTLKPGDTMPTESLENHVIVNVGQFQSGSGFNVVSDLAVLRVNIRTGLPKVYDEIRKKIDTYISHYNTQDGIWIELHEQTVRPARLMDSATKKILQHIQECGKALDVTIDCRASCGASDANILSHCDLPTIDSLGAIGGNIHTHDEYILTTSLAHKAKLTALFLMKLGNGEYTLDQIKKTIEL